MDSDEPKQMTVRMRGPTYALFEQMQRQLQEGLPYGTVTKADLLDICVNSTSELLMAQGKIQLDKRPKEDTA
jgi:hypothetical protein